MFCMIVCVFVCACVCVMCVCEWVVKGDRGAGGRWAGVYLCQDALVRPYNHRPMRANWSVYLRRYLTAASMQVGADEGFHQGQRTCACKRLPAWRGGEGKRKGRIKRLVGTNPHMHSP